MNSVGILFETVLKLSWFHNFKCVSVCVSKRLYFQNKKFNSWNFSKIIYKVIVTCNSSLTALIIKCKGDVREDILF